ncbi:hypothetical protein [Vallitalea guaymasensis]|uniref:Lipoprotein n=1 Tax=Vallitalea guaymasensis TaxID=1185412 RepID=A0A8J8MDK2_9FIRM|nr:hypothetical protein [Vallitalea guaymasensis]QUH31079.1 hypothetical protein HYG85_20005 [Vallitalea guaymasensis]
MMRKNKKLILMLLVSTIIFSITACKNTTDNKKSYETNRFYMITNNTISLTYNDDFSHSFYYKLDKKYKIKLELIIKKKEEVIGRIELEDIKDDVADIDGTFGLLVDRDKDNNKIVWTIRHDEITKKLETLDLFFDVGGHTGTICDSGILDEDGIIAIGNQYDIKNEEYDNRNEKYDWSMEFKVYGIEVNDEINSYINN